MADEEGKKVLTAQWFEIGRDTPSKKKKKKEEKEDEKDKDKDMEVEEPESRSKEEEEAAQTHSPKGKSKGKGKGKGKGKTADSSEFADSIKANKKDGTLRNAGQKTSEIGRDPRVGNQGYYGYDGHDDLYYPGVSSGSGHDQGQVPSVYGKDRRKKAGGADGQERVR